MRECAEKLESKDGRGKEQDDQEGLRAGSGDGRCGSVQRMSWNASGR